MPKMKTRRAAKKRFKKSATGKLSHKHAFQSHNLEHKSRKRKRSFRKDQSVSDADAKVINRMIGRNG
jgi:large subunit ribosomal protein L35